MSQHFVQRLPDRKDLERGLDPGFLKPCILLFALLVRSQEVRDLRRGVSLGEKLRVIGNYYSLTRCCLLPAEGSPEGSCSDGMVHIERLHVQELHRQLINMTTNAEFRHDYGGQVHRQFSIEQVLEVAKARNRLAV